MPDLHYPRGARIPDHPESGRCIGEDPDGCVRVPSFTLYCPACFTYYEMCALHAMTYGQLEQPECPACEHVPFELAPM